MTIHVDLIPVTDPRLKRHVEHDDRSRDFAFTAVPPKDITVIHDDLAPVLDQGNIGGCVGWTGADVLNTAMFTPVRNLKRSGNFFDDSDGLIFYSLATHKDNIAGYYPKQDTGSSGLGLAKALKSLGLIDRYLHCFTWVQYLAALATQPVAVGTLWTNQMFNPDRNGVVSVGALNNSTIAGGHEYMIRGRRADLGLNLCRNHWTPTWDKSNAPPKIPGEFWLTDNDLKLLLLNQGDVTVLHGVGLP